MTSRWVRPRGSPSSRHRQAPRTDTATSASPPFTELATGEGLAFHLALVALISGSVLCVSATVSWILADFNDWRRSESCRALMAQADAAAAIPPDLEPSAPVPDARAENDGLRQRQVLHD